MRSYDHDAMYDRYVDLRIFWCTSLCSSISWPMNLSLVPGTGLEVIISLITFFKYALLPVLIMLVVKHPRPTLRLYRSFVLDEVNQD